MEVREIMVRPVVTVHTDIPAKEAAALLARHRITAMPVLDADDAAQVRTQLDAYPGSGMPIPGVEYGKGDNDVNDDRFRTPE